MNKAEYTSSGIVKFATIDECKKRYRLSRNTIMKVASDNNALRKIGTCVRVDVTKLDGALELYDY